MSKRETALFALILVLIWAALDGVNHLLFHRPQDVYFYTLLDLSFIPLEVLVLYLVVDRLLARRERQGRLHKLNMVIGTFFSTLGRPLLHLLTEMVTDREEVSAHLAVAPEWEEAQLRQAAEWVKTAHFHLVADPAHLAALREFLAGQREFMVRLLENPAVLEHEEFSDLLWALSHLEEEMSARQALENLPPSDLAHLAADAERAYGRLLAQWLEYMVHLRKFYPYLFSFAARTNPLREGARAEVE
jgi:hypothetical protein